LGVAVVGLIAGVARLNAATPLIVLVTPEDPQPVGATFDVLIGIESIDNLGAWEFDLGYDPAMLTVTGMTLNPAFGVEDNCNAQTQRCALALGPIVDRAGTANLGAVTYGNAAGLSGKGVVAVIHLTATGQPGETTLTLSNALVADVNAQATTPTVHGGGVITIREAAHRLFLPSVTR
jgi:hypothetical protein